MKLKKSSTGWILMILSFLRQRFVQAFSTESFSKIYFFFDAMTIENYPRKIDQHLAILKPTFAIENKAI